MSDRKDAETMVTYRRADGEPVCGEYDFVTGLEWFEDDWEPTQLIEERWRRVTMHYFTVNEDKSDESESE